MTRKFIGSGKKRLMAALAGGAVTSGLYRLYLYTNDREQFEDSNLLVSAGLIFIAASLIFLVLEIGTIRRLSR